MTTPILGLTELIASQSQPHVPLNTAIRALEGVCQICVVAVQNAPPGSPADGETYIVGSSPTGAWVGHEDEVALLIGGGWRHFAPVNGWIAYNQATAQFLFYDSSVPGWAFLVTRGAPVVEVDADLALADTHNGGVLVIPEGTSPAVTITVPLDSSDPLAPGHTTTIVNMSALAATIEIESGSPQDVIYRSPGGSIAPISLGQFRCIQLIKISATTWIATGVGFSSSSAPVAEFTVTGADATDITISGLDLDTDGEYVVTFDLDNGSGSTMNLSLFYNGDTTAANYYTQVMSANGSTAAAARANNAILSAVAAGHSCSGEMTIRPNFDGRPQCRSNVSRGHGSDCVWITSSHTHQTVGNVTSLTLNSSVASALSIGSKVRVFVR